MATTLVSGLIILIIVLGTLASGILFIIGLIRLLMKKGPKILIISIVMFIVITIIFFISRIIFATALGPSINQQLQTQSTPMTITFPNSTP